MIKQIGIILAFFMGFNFSVQGADSSASSPIGSKINLNVENTETSSITDAINEKVFTLMNHDWNHGSYFDWGRGRDGWGYCYEWASNGQPLNQGNPVSNYNCERGRPSYFDWGRGRDGWGYCYQYTPYRDSMNQGNPVSNYNCERTRPSYYAWGRGQDGYTYCYQYTARGDSMNAGAPVSNYNCR